MFKDSTRDQFAHQITDRSRGGLIVCGLNWGAGYRLPATYDAAAKPPFFLSASNLDVYQRRIAKWFSCWGVAIGDVVPSDAILQTNLFLSESRNFRIESVPLVDWVPAVQRLTHAVAELDGSGVIFFSKGLVPWTLNPEFPETDSPLLGRHVAWTPPIGGSLSLRFAEAGDVQLANCAHPSGTAIADRDLAETAPRMGAWVRAVVARYHRVQAG
jgi:hypothetical protein